MHPELLHLARRCVATAIIREAELDLRKRHRPRGASSSPPASPRSAPTTCSSSSRTGPRRRRVEEIRRDFLANVSHELKTPVGGISLLAEAVLDAHDDPEAVARFARRISVESDRLTRLVKEIVELSRLRGPTRCEDPPSSTSAAAPVTPPTAAGSSPRSNASRSPRPSTTDCEVWGDAELVTTAISNLVGNAIAYSDSGTRVGVVGAARTPTGSSTSP